MAMAMATYVQQHRHVYYKSAQTRVLGYAPSRHPSADFECGAVAGVCKIGPGWKKPDTRCPHGGLGLGLYSL
ncbi:hypothetical protein PG984_001189 [Apiospora sp. TS-2023a]